MERSKGETKEQPTAAKPRAFKAKMFARSCRKAGISDNAKQDRDNIDNDELAAFKKLAKDVGKADDAKLDELVANGEYQEICK